MTMAYSTDPTIWLYTSLSSGSSQIVTATSRLETILKANKIPFKAVDVATDEKARTLWGRRAGKRKLPGLVRMGEVLADINEVEEWNEYGEIKEMLAAEGDAPAPAPTPATGPASAAGTPKPLPATKEAEIHPAITTTSKSEEPSEKSSPKSPQSAMSPLAATMQAIGFEAAEKASKVKAKLKSPTSKASTAATESPKSTTTPKEDLSKLENSATVPPPAAESTAEEAKAPTTSAAAVSSKGDDVPTAESKPAVTSPSESALQSPSSTAAASTDSIVQPPVGAQIKTHRGSSISAASAEEIAAVEQANKIDEEPEAEEDVAEDSKESKERMVSPAAAKQDLVQSTESKAVEEKGEKEEEEEEEEKGEGEKEEEEEEQLEERAQEKRQNEPHVKFIGETPGQEIDRVKATLGGGKEGDKAKEKKVVAVAIEPAASDAAAAPSAIAAEAHENPSPPTISIVEPAKTESSLSTSEPGHARRISNPPQMDLKPSPTIVPTKDALDLNSSLADPALSDAAAAPSAIAAEATEELQAGKAAGESKAGQESKEGEETKAEKSTPEASKEEETPQGTITASDQVEALPEMNTQEQEAAEARMAWESVAN